MISEKRKEASPEHGFQTVLRGFFLLIEKRNRHGRRCLVTLRRKENGWFCPAFAGKSGTGKWKLFYKITGGGKNPTKKQGTSPYNGEETTALGDTARGRKGSDISRPVPFPAAAAICGKNLPIYQGKQSVSVYAAQSGGMEEGMELNAKSVDRKLLVELSGDLDHHGAREAIRQLELAIDAALPRQLVLDMAGVGFMDSSGIALIMRAQQRMQLLDGSLLVCNVSSQARRVLDVAGIGRRVTIR